MKKIASILLLLAVAAGITLMSSCSKDDDKPNNETIQDGLNNSFALTDIYGTWLEIHENDTTMITIDETQITIDDQVSRYTLKNDTIHFTIYETMEVNAKVKLLYEKNVIVFVVNDEGYDEVARMGYRQGSTVNTTTQPLQGKWIWYAFGTPQVRTQITIDGDNIELIVPVWGQRYTGTYTYTGGIIHMKTNHFYLGSDDLDDENPDGSTWIEQNFESASFDINDHSMTFVTDGDVAYGSVANLMSLFHKK